MNIRSVLHVTGWVAVICAVGLMGPAQALPGTNTVDSRDIINGQVKRVDIAKGAVNSARVANGSLKSVDIRDGTLTGADLADGAIDSSKVADGSLTSGDIQDGTLTGADLASGAIDSARVADESLTSADIQDGTLTGADIANNTLTGTDIANNTLTGTDVAESTLNLGNLCQPGLVHSWARVKGSASMPATFTSSSTYVDTVHNCAAGAVLVRRDNTGYYFVRFTGDPALLAQVTIYYNGDAIYDKTVSYTKSGQDFVVFIDNNAGGWEDGWFTITTF